VRAINDSSVTWVSLICGPVDGHYLNLPVVEEDGRLVAIVDVLKLTYATLEQVRSNLSSNLRCHSFSCQMNHMTAEAAGEATQDAEGGPMWGRFFDSIGGHDDGDSAYSGSHLPMDVHNSSFSLSQLQHSAHSEVHPNDSASVADDASALGAGGRNGNVPSIMGLAVPPVDDGTYVFKFRTPSGNTHRFQARKDNVENLRDIVSGKLTADSFFTEFKTTNPDDPVPDPLDFQLAYTDADGDTVLITSDTDVTDAVKIARNAGVDRVALIVQGGRGWAEAGAGKSEAKAEAAAAAAAQDELKEVEKSEGVYPEGNHSNPPAPAHIPSADEIFGIPRDLLLPASIGALAVVIIGVFTIARLTRD
jgi:PB1 domain